MGKAAKAINDAKKSVAEQSIRKIGKAEQIGIRYSYRETVQDTRIQTAERYATAVEENNAIMQNLVLLGRIQMASVGKPRYRKAIKPESAGCKAIEELICDGAELLVPKEATSG